MKKYILSVLTAVLLFASLSLVSAQTSINNDSLFNNRAYVKAGIDPATMLTFGYERKLGVPVLGNSLVTYAEWGVSVAKFENADFKIGAVLPLFRNESFQLLNRLNFSAGMMTAKNFDSKKFAVADEIAIGLYKPKWFVAMTAEYEKIFLNHIEHSDFYRETYYEDAVDGWYKGAGGMFQFGFEAGRTFYDRIDVHLELKTPFTEEFNSYRGSPAHLNLGIGYRF